MKNKQDTQKEKQEKFKRILEIRLNGFIMATDKLSKLANKSYFDYSNDERENIFSIIDEEVVLLKAKFLRHDK